MKKRVYIAWGLAGVIVIILGIVIFINKNKVINDESNINLTIQTVEENDYESCWNPGIHDIARAEGGYYYLRTEQNGMYLHYFDKNLKKSVLVCGKAECGHNDLQCNAYFSSFEYLSSPIYYYEGNIYMVRLKDGMGILTRINPDGSEREEIAELFPNSNVTSISMVFHENCVYAYDHAGHSGSKEENTECIKKISLNDNSSKIIYEYTGVGSAISGARSFGNKLFFKVMNYQLDKETLEQSINYELYVYDYETGETQRVSDKNISDYYVDLENNILYYFEIGEGLYRCLLDGSDKKLIYKADSSMVVASLSYDGKYLYMGNGGMGSVTNAASTIDRLLYVLDTDGKVLNKIELKKGMRLYYGDNEYLFVEDNGIIMYIEKKDILSSTEWIAID